MAMFRFKKRVHLKYEQQGYVYFLSLLYNRLEPARQAKIRELCEAAGGEYADALFKFVTTDTTATAICMRYHLSKATLYRAVVKYYESFPQDL